MTDTSASPTPIAPADPTSAVAPAAPTEPVMTPQAPAVAANPFDDAALAGKQAPPEGEGADPSADPTDEGAEGGADGEGEAPVGAPEEYADFSLPEGVALEPALLGEFKVVAKELNLPQDAAQKVVDIAAKLPAMFAEAQAQEVTAIQADWAAQAKADPEIGGAKLVTTIADAKRGLDALQTPGFNEVLSAFGLAKHPEVLRAFAKLGKLVAEDGFVGGGDPAGEKVLAEHKLYPGMK